MSEQGEPSFSPESGSQKPKKLRCLIVTLAAIIFLSGFYFSVNAAVGESDFLAQIFSLAKNSLNKIAVLLKGDAGQGKAVEEIPLGISGGGSIPDNFTNSGSENFQKSSPPANGESKTSKNAEITVASNAGASKDCGDPLRAPSFLVLINEVAWAGTGSEKTADEWLELKNNSAAAVNLDGWLLANKDKSIKVSFGSKDVIEPGNYYLLERTDDDSVPGVAADKIFTGAIKNSDEALKLFSQSCALIDEVFANVGNGVSWPAGTAGPEYRAAERGNDLSWHTYNDSGFGTAPKIFGTPKSTNSPPGSNESQVQNPTQPPAPVLTSPAPPASSPQTSQTTNESQMARSNINHILISQIQITGGAGQTTNDFVEIYNPTAESFNLKGHRLVKRAKNSTSDTSIKSWISDAFVPPYGFYLWANSGYSGISPSPDAATTASIADDNGIAIRFGSSDTGAIIDSVAWGGAQNAFIEGSVFPVNPGPNRSMIRKGWQGSCVPASSDATIGNGCDTDNNASDFEEAPNSSPRNSGSP